MSILFYQILLVIFAALFIVASFGEKRQENRYADCIMAFLLLVLLFATFVWRL